MYIERKELMFTSKEELKSLAVTVHNIYNKTLNLKLNVHQAHHIKSLDSLSPDTQRQLVKTAFMILEISADPFFFIEAQFKAFEAVGKRKKFVLYPRLRDLSSLAAKIRYAEQQALQTDRETRDITSKSPVFDREARKVASLSKAFKKPEIDVLLTYPREFTQGYLEHRGVWKEVQNSYFI